eukprot:g6779.t1
MFTKTGLRPREVQSRGDARSGIGKKLPPVTSTPRRDFFYAGGGGAPAMSSMRRKKAGSRGSSTSSTSIRGRGDLYKCGSGGGSGSGSRSRSRSQSAGRNRGASGTTRAHRLTRKRPEWDGSLRDTSQYRLTAEEALRRKMSLVSKHNTLVFGLGGGCTSKMAAAAASSPSSAATATASATKVAPRRSTKQQHQHQQPHQSRKTRGGGASAVGSSSSLSAIYGGGSGGCKGKVAVLRSAPATDADLTAAISEEGGEPACAGGINDSTMSLYTKQGGRGSGGSCVNASEHQDDGDVDRSDCCGSGSGGSTCGADGGDVVESTLLGGEGSASGTEACGASGLAGLEVGIRAFSERVELLETLGKAGLLEDESAEGRRRRSGTVSKSVSEGQDKDDEAGGGSQQSGNVSPSHAAALDGLASDDPLSHRTPRQDDTDGRHMTAATQDGGGSEVHHRHHGNPWSFAAPPSSSSSFREQQRRRAAAVSQPSSTSGGGGGKKEVGLAKRVELLEARILELCSPRSPVIADSNMSSNAESSNQDHKAFLPEVGCETTAAAFPSRSSSPGPGTPRTTREEQLRAVVVDLLSLSGALLERATSAERRLRELGRRSGNFGGLDSVVVVDSGDVFEMVRRVRASAEAAFFPADDDGDAVPITAAQGGATTHPPAAAAAGGAGAATVVAPSLAEEGASPLSGGRPRRVSSSPPAPQNTTVPRPATTDCWGEALDAVGRLVDSQPSGSVFGLDNTDDDDGNEPSSVQSSPTQQWSPSCPSLPPALMGNKLFSAAAVLVPAPPNSGFAEAALPRPMLPPPPPPPPPRQSAGSDNGRGVARQYLWEAAPLVDDAGLSVLDASWTSAALATDGGPGGTDRYAHLSRPPLPAGQKLGGPVGHEQEGDVVVEENEEDSRASPAFLAPNPSQKPQHPFRGQQCTAMQSAVVLRSSVGRHGRGEPICGWEAQGGVIPSPRPGGVVDGHIGGGGPVRELGGEGHGGGDRVDKAPRPPIGQWYTPPPLVVQD